MKYLMVVLIASIFTIIQPALAQEYFATHPTLEVVLKNKEIHVFLKLERREITTNKLVTERREIKGAIRDIIEDLGKPESVWYFESYTVLVTVTNPTPILEASQCWVDIFKACALRGPAVLVLNFTEHSGYYSKQLVLIERANGAFQYLHSTKRDESWAERRDTLLSGMHLAGYPLQDDFELLYLPSWTDRIHYASHYQKLLSDLFGERVYSW